MDHRGHAFLGNHRQGYANGTVSMTHTAVGVIEGDRQNFSLGTAVLDTKASANVHIQPFEFSFTDPVGCLISGWLASAATKRCASGLCRGISNRLKTATHSYSRVNGHALQQSSDFSEDEDEGSCGIAENLFDLNAPRLKCGRASIGPFDLLSTRSG